jgi:molecular chaperone DnaK (HSP70)
MSSTPIFIGIDLGTSNCAVATVSAESDAISLLPITQISQAGQLISESMLPSLSYLPLAEEQAASAATLPWSNEGVLRDFVVGAWAKTRAQEVPDRVITSAKSWLCNPHVDRLGDILPWQGSCEKKLSPVAALQSYLTHLRCAYTHVAAGIDWQAIPLVLTVPASFDEVARSLTHQAALAAGFGNVTLLEEPLAAFYAWLAAHEKSWREQITVGDLVLVCDVGGGTTDFSLVAVCEKEGNLSLERVSVGDHLLLGGDNMDLALAYMLKAKLAKEQQVHLDNWQFLALIASVRSAKEQLLAGDSAVESLSLAIASKSARLFAKSVSVTLDRKEVQQLLVEGFFPLATPEDEPRAVPSSGIQEFGLPFERDAAITRHLARFLRRSRKNVDSHPELKELFAQQLGHTLQGARTRLMPTAVLFNGGVFNAPALQARIVAALTSWAGGSALKQLASSQLDLAVAQGAAYFSKHKVLGQGIRVHAGTAKSYYIGIETSMLAVPGIEPELKGLCVLPQGSAEGSSFTLPHRQFGVVTGQPTKFRFFSSSHRAGDEVGSEVDSAVETLEETAELQITLPALTQGSEREVVPVELATTITEVGTLQVYMQHVHSAQRWQVEFNVRQS